MALIEVHNLHKVFKVTRKKKGLLGSFQGLVRPVRDEVHAVNDISFNIEAGEIVGFIGPNGAGKSTTIKMLSGILYPTSGVITINGISPQENRRAVVRNLGVVFGQRTQLYWDLRLGESFELFKRIYQIEDAVFKTNVDMLFDVLQIHELIDIPVRQLSLGQRMRGELAAAMLHSPSILFLDEPTIGMDIEVKSAIRNFILDINRLRKTTVLLTTHDLDDVEELCRRLIIINKGQIVEDNPLEELIDRIAPYRYLLVDSAGGIGEFSHPHAEIIREKDDLVWIRFVKERVSASELINQLSRQCNIRDVSVREPEIEDVIRKIYKGDTD